MTMRRSATLALLLLGLLVACSPDNTPGVDKQDLAGRRAACAACHGKTGIAQAPSFPTIAGQPTEYLVRAMTAYREGRRDNAIMNGQMRGFTDAEIQALAIYYHQQSSPLARHIEPDGAHTANDQGATQ
ncbi:MAG: cytochrome C [Xanthomonadales bacterium]|nr:cytochrome C [Xanthomonadales bacterium]